MLLMALVLFGDSSDTIQRLESGGIAAIVGAMIAGAVAVANQRRQSKVDDRRVSLDEFEALKSSYREEIVELRRTVAASTRREEQLRRQIIRLERRIRELSAELGNP